MISELIVYLYLTVYCGDTLLADGQCLFKQKNGVSYIVINTIKKFQNSVRPFVRPASVICTLLKIPTLPSLLIVE